MLLRFRLDKTAKQNVKVTRRYCNIDCVWCHHDYFQHNGFISISNEDFANAVNRIIKVAGGTEASVRLAGDGDPTVVGADELCDLIGRLKKIPQVSAVKMTTNGILLGGMSTALKTAGIDSVTVSLNSLDKREYIRYAGYDYLDSVLSSISTAFNAGIKLKINCLYWKFNSQELDKFEELSCKYDGMVIKFFDLLVHSEETRSYYLPLTQLEEQLTSLGAQYYFEENPYPKRVYTLPSGAIFEVKVAGRQNTCPNLMCLARSICLEGCRHSIRIGLDGILRPCGVRSDNIVNLLDARVSDKDIWNALHSGGKVGYFTVL